MLDLDALEAAAKAATPRFYFFSRGGEHPGITVSKNPTLPAGDFRITEYVFKHGGYESLWFVDADKFTRRERQAAYESPRVLQPLPPLPTA